MTRAKGCGRHDEKRILRRSRSNFCLAASILAQFVVGRKKAFGTLGGVFALCDVLFSC
jgi:hypothetical protein